MYLNKDGHFFFLIKKYNDSTMRLLTNITNEIKKMQKRQKGKKYS
jgi:hypothetical protein